jgi:hypothetical protein
MSDFVSMRVVAEAAGVSKAAVSRVINGRPAGIRISVTTRDRILAAVRQFGYQPTRFAQDQAPRRQAAIALVLASGGLDASAAHLPVIESVLTANGYRLLLAILPADSGAARERVTALLQDGVAGFLCAPAVMLVVVDLVAGACPVVVMDAAGGEAILRSLGVDIPVPVIPPPVIQPVPVVSPPVTQPVPAISPPVIKPAPSVVAAVTGGTVPEPTLPVITVTPVPTPVVAPNPNPETQSDTLVGVPASAGVPNEPTPAPVPEPAVIEPPFVAPVTELNATDPAPLPAPDPQPLPDLVVSEPVPEPEPIPVPVPEPVVIEPSPVIPDQSAVVSEPVPPPVAITPDPIPEPPSDTPAGVPASAGVADEPIPVSESASPVAEPIPPDPAPEPVSAPVPAPAPIESSPVADPPAIPVPVPEPAPLPVEPVTPPAPIIEPVPESLPYEPEPVVEVPVVAPVNSEPTEEVAVPEEDGTAQPDQSILSSPPEKVSE